MIRVGKVICFVVELYCNCLFSFGKKGKERGKWVCITGSNPVLVIHGDNGWCSPLKGHIGLAERSVAVGGRASIVYCSQSKGIAQVIQYYQSCPQFELGKK